MSEGDDGRETIKVTDLRKFLIDCFCAVGLKKSHSETMAESLLTADLTGKHSHGIFRLDRFLDDAHKGSVDANGEPAIIKETPATAWVDGRNSLGAVVGTFCMKLAIEKAKQVGAAIVGAKNSNNFGVSSFYSKQALKEGLIGFSVTNSSPLMLSTRAKEARTGTNPLSLAAPALDGDYFLLDMATTIASGGNIEIKYHEGEFLPIGWAVNAAGLPETNPDVALKSSRFLPLGSSEELGSHKGTGLSIMIDILCGVLNGTHYAQSVNVWTGRLEKTRAGTGHCFIVIDPKMFAQNFEDRLSDFMSDLREMETDDPSKPVRIPGDRGRQIMKDIEKNGGITFPKYVIANLKKIAVDLKINCVAFVPKKKKVQLTPSEELAARLEAEANATVPSGVTEEVKSEASAPVDQEEEIALVFEDSSDWICPFDGTSIERIREERMSEYRKTLNKQATDMFEAESAQSKRYSVGRKSVSTNKDGGLSGKRKSTVGRKSVSSYQDGGQSGTRKYGAGRKSVSSYQDGGQSGTKKYGVGKKYVAEDIMSFNQDGEQSSKKKYSEGRKSVAGDKVSFHQNDDQSSTKRYSVEKQSVADDKVSSNQDGEEEKQKDTTV